MSQLVSKSVVMVLNMSMNVMMAIQFQVMAALEAAQSNLDGHASMVHLVARVVAISSFLMLLYSNLWVLSISEIEFYKVYVLLIFLHA